MSQSSKSAIYDSPVSSMLGTNVVPSDEDAAVIQSLLAKGREDLVYLDLEYARLQKASQEILNERTKLQAQIHAHESLLSPARRLPPEIVALIFRHCLPINVSDLRIDPESAPLSLCQICSGWREVALSTPSLWSMVSVKDPVPNVQLVEQWLHRSGANPLHLNIQATGPGWDRILRAFIIHSNRWREIEFPVSFIPYFSETPLRQMPSLETLTLMIPTLTDSALEELHEFVNSAPQLRRMCLSLFGAQWQALKFPWSRLTELVINRWFNVDECLHLLHNCHSLEAISLQGIRTPSPVTTSTSQPVVPLVLSKLRKINLSANKPLNRLFDSLCMPALESLEICSRSTITWYSPHLHSLLHRSACPLEELILSGGDMTEQSLIEILSLVPSLRELSVRASPRPSFVLSNALIDRLTYDTEREKSKTPPLLPRLETLKINANCICPQNRLADMIESRWWTSAHGPKPTRTRLRTVEIEPENPLDKDIRWRFQKCREEGLQFSNWRDIVDGPFHLSYEHIAAK